MQGVEVLGRVDVEAERPDLRALHEALAGRPGVAPRTRALLARMLSAAPAAG